MASLDPEPLGDRGEGARDERQVALELVEEALLRGREARGHRLQNPIRLARAVKKMPDGLSAGISATCCSDSVS